MRHSSLFSVSRLLTEEGKKEGSFDIFPSSFLLLIARGPLNNDG
jgi:hypothetical protein